MKKISTLIVLCCTLFTGNANAQRYLAQVFDEVDITTSVTYGVNATVLTYQVFGQAVPENLLLDVYEPSGDVETSRPLIMYFHTGNFLPQPSGGNPTGNRQDSSVVELCTRLAKMGYVVASCSYRLGWNPVASLQTDRVKTLINAAYRGVQDSRTAARFFRKSAAIGGNPYGIDPTKIAIWGQGTGGYIAFASSTINQYSDIVIPKFISDVEVQPGVFFPLPMVLEQVNGNPDGLSYGINPNDNDTLCYINHEGYDSNFACMVNMGGALGDSTWITIDDIPMISFHSPTDPFAPYNIGTVIVPGLNLPVVEVSGSFNAQKKANQLALNHVFDAVETLNDQYTQKANLYNNGYHGLYPLNRQGAEIFDSAPWEWWNTANPASGNGLQTNPNMAAAKGKLFCDTIIAYAAPRLMCALNLPGNPCEIPGPENDECAGAFDINTLFGGGPSVEFTSIQFTNSGATPESTDPGGYDCWIDTDVANDLDNSLDNSVWFTFDGDGAEYAIVVDDCNGTATFTFDDSQMAVYSGNGCGNLVPVACSEDIAPDLDIYNAGLVLPTVANTTYYILIDGFNYIDIDGPIASGDFCITVANTAVSVNEIDKSNVVMFPNPADNQFTITADQNISMIEIHNLVGSLVATENNVNKKIYNMNTQLSKGVYMVTVYTTNGKSVQKLIIE